MNENSPIRKNPAATQDLQRLDRSVLLNETGAPFFTRWAVLISLSIILFFIVWACMIHVDEVAHAKGELVSSHALHPIQHRDGGILTKVFVKEGETVQKGQIISLLDTQELTSQIDETKMQHELARARRKRLELFLQEKSNYKPEHEWTEIERHQSAQLLQSLKTLRSSREVIEEQVKQIQQELIEDQLELKNAKSQLALTLEEQQRHTEKGLVSVQMLEKEKGALEEELDIREDLVDRGLNSDIKFLALQRQYYQIQKDLHEKKVAHEERSTLLMRQIQQFEKQTHSLPHKITRKRASIAELQASLKQKESEIMDQALATHDQVYELEQISGERLKRLRERLDQSHIRSPIEGYVHNLRPLGYRSVIAPGEVLCSIVPLDATIMAEIHVDNRDIGHLNLNQDVRIKITSFDFSRYGSLPGRLSLLSASKSMDPQGQPYFLAQIELLSHSPAHGRQELPLRVGMSLDADIITGQKTVMEYLLKPIYASTIGTMQER